MKINVEYVKGVAARAWQKDNRKITIFVTVVVVVAILLVISAVF